MLQKNDAPQHLVKIIVIAIQFIPRPRQTKVNKNANKSDKKTNGVREKGVFQLFSAGARKRNGRVGQLRYQLCDW